MKYRKKDKKNKYSPRLVGYPPQRGGLGVVKKIILQSIACVALAICLLVVFFCFNPVYEKYNSVIENNIKYNVDIIGVIKSVLVYVNII